MAPKSADQIVENEGSPLLLSNNPSTAYLDKNDDQKQDVSLWTKIKDEIAEQMETAFPTLQSMVITKIPWFISLRFVGGIGAEELAAAALATTLCNVTGLSFSVGLSSALSTLSGQAKGELLSRSLVKQQHGRRSTEVNEEVERGSATQESNEEMNDEPLIASIREENNNNDNEEPLTPLVFLYRGIFVQILLVLPIGIWWIFGIKDLLIALGQLELVASMTEEYLRVLAPALWAYSLNWTLTVWLQSIGMADVPAYAAMLGFSFHVPFNWFFIYYLDMGYIGCGVATVCFHVVQSLFMFSYLFGLQHGRTRALESMGGRAIGRTRLSFWNEFFIAISSIRGYIQYTGLALPGIVIISEWWASETSIFLSGRLQPNPEIALGGMTIYQSINAFCFMFPVAFSVSASTRVGNLLGLGNPQGAAFAAKVSIALAACVSFVIGLLLMGLPHTFLPSLIAPDEEDVILQTSLTIPLLSTYVFADGIQCAINGVIRGCGRQCITIPIVVLSYWVIGVPLAYYLAFVRNEGEMFCDDSYFCGDVGLVTGMTTGTWVHMLLLALAVSLTTDWKMEAQKAKERVASKN